MNPCTMNTLLDDYVDGALPAAVCRRVEEHLGHCADCRDQVGWLRTLHATTAGLPTTITPSGDLWPGVLRRIGPSVDLKPVRTSQRTRMGMHPAWACALSAAACILFTFVGPWTESPLGARRSVACAGPGTSDQAMVGSSDEGANAADQVRDVMSRHIAMVDDAIHQLLTALREDPTDLRLVHLLRQEYQRKVSLVCSTARLMNELDATTSSPTG